MKLTPRLAYSVVLILSSAAFSEIKPKSLAMYDGSPMPMCAPGGPCEPQEYSASLILQGIKRRTVLSLKIVVAAVTGWTAGVVITTRVRTRPASNIFDQVAADKRKEK